MARATGTNLQYTTVVAIEGLIVNGGNFMHTKDEDFGTELENVMNGYEELSKSVEENTVAYEEKALSQIEENLRTMRDQYISMEK